MNGPAVPHGTCVGSAYRSHLKPSQVSRFRSVTPHASRTIAPAIQSNALSPSGIASSRCGASAPSGATSTTYRHGHRGCTVSKRCRTVRCNGSAMRGAGRCSLPPQSPLDNVDIELVTQVSLDRWPRFAQQALAWGGPASVAVYLPCPPDHPLAPAYQQHLHSLVTEFQREAAKAAADAAAAATGAGHEAVPLVAPRLTVTVVHAGHLAPEGAAVLPGIVPPPAPAPPPPLQLLPSDPASVPSAVNPVSPTGHGYGYEYEQLYPINALRNAALRAASCSHVFLVDGDFIPSAGLRESLLTPRLQPCWQTEASAVGVTASGGGGGHGSGGGTGLSLLELSDRHPRPVMWVVPAFEVLGPDGGDVGNASSGNSGSSSSGGGGSSGGGSAAPRVGEVPDERRAQVPRTLEQLAAYRYAGADPSAMTSSALTAATVLSGGGSTHASGRLRPFHCGRYPQPVPSIDYDRWWELALHQAGSSVGWGGAAAAAEWTVVPYHEYFEPYGIVKRDQVPEYDERFRGYGLNKVQHAYHMAAAGFEFRLLTSHFCVTVPHARSPSFRTVFGSAADPAQRARVEHLYESFREEMHDKYGYRYEFPAKTCI